jgi:uncharacterized membrane protein
MAVPPAPAPSTAIFISPLLDKAGCIARMATAIGAQRSYGLMEVRCA